MLYLFVDLVVGHVYSTFALALPCVRLLVRLLVCVVCVYTPLSSYA